MWVAPFSQTVQFHLNFLLFNFRVVVDHLLFCPCFAAVPHSLVQLEHDLVLIF